MEIGDRDEKTSSHGNLGAMLRSVGEYAKAKQYLEKVFAILKEIGDIDGQGTVYGDLGSLSMCLGEFLVPKEYFDKALEIKIRDPLGEAANYQALGRCVSISCLIPQGQGILSQSTCHQK